MRVHTMQELGAALRQARTELRLTQADVADRVGVSRDWVVRLEHGHPRLEAQLVLDALEAVGLTVALDSDADAPADDSAPALDDVFTNLSVPPATDQPERGDD